MWNERNSWARKRKDWVLTYWGMVIPAPTLRPNRRPQFWSITLTEVGCDRKLSPEERYPPHLPSLPHFGLYLNPLYWLPSQLICQDINQLWTLLSPLGGRVKKFSEEFCSKDRYENQMRRTVRGQVSIYWLKLFLSALPRPWNLEEHWRSRLKSSRRKTPEGHIYFYLFLFSSAQGELSRASQKSHP